MFIKHHGLVLRIWLNFETTPDIRKNGLCFVHVSHAQTAVRLGISGDFSSFFMGSSQAQRMPVRPRFMKEVFTLIQLSLDILKHFSAVFSDKMGWERLCSGRLGRALGSPLARPAWLFHPIPSHDRAAVTTDIPPVALWAAVSRRGLRSC